MFERRHPMDGQLLEMVVKNLRQHVCDCVIAVPVTPHVLQLSIACLKSNSPSIELRWDADKVGVYLSDCGIVRERIAQRTDPKVLRRLNGQLQAEALKFGVELRPVECIVPVEASTAGDGYSRLMQFLSRCEVVLRGLPESDETPQCRQQVRELLRAAAGEKACRLIADNAGEPDPSAPPFRVCTRPPWQVFVVETDRDASAVIQQLQSDLTCDCRRLVIYQNQLRIRRKLVAQIADLVDRQFSNVQDSGLILGYLRREVFASQPSPDGP
jgi:hypothetical protein